MMSMKRIVLLIFAINCSICVLFAQERVVVTDKNGTLTIGEIIENNSEFIRVVKYDDKLIRIIYRSNIKSIVPAEEKSIPPLNHLYSRDLKNIEELKKPQKGFQQSVELQLCNYTYLQGFKIFDSANYIVGYRFNDYLYLGGGIGVGVLTMPRLPILKYHNLYLEGGDVKIYIPLYAHFRAYLTKTRVQPFIDLSIGGKFPIPSKISLSVEYYNYNYPIEYCIAGMLLQPGVGANYRYNKKMGVYAKLNYVGSSMTTPIGNYYNEIVIKHKMYHGVSLSIGCTF